MKTIKKTIEPDGWVDAESSSKTCQYIYFAKEAAQIAVGSTGKIKPICLVSPEEMLRLRTWEALGRESGWVMEGDVENENN